MDNFNISFSRTLYTFNEQLYSVIKANISIISGTFTHRAERLFVFAFNSTNTVEAFSCMISPNKKNINAFFTIDAFNVFSGNTSIGFGYGIVPIHIFENIDINNSTIEPLDPLISGISALDADNAWLESLS
jgi:hypothetical protein